MDIKIGDTVRYLNDIGGGKVTAVLPDNRVLVMDESGFEIPVPLKEVVVVSRKKTAESRSKNESTNSSSVASNTEYKDLFFFPPGKLLSGNNNPKIFLGFVSQTEQVLNSQLFDLILLNDSNYTVFFVVNQIDTLNKPLVYPGILGPNCREKLNSINRNQLQTITEFQIHTVFYSKENLPIIRPWFSSVKVEYQLFERNTAFKTTVFFDQLALIYKLKDDALDEKILQYSLEKLRKENHTEQSNKILFDTSPKKQDKVKKTVEKLREVDLHIQALLDDPSIFTPKEILDYQMQTFRREMERAIIDNVERIVFIHGLGNGTLKTEIRKTLERDYKKYEYNDASFKEYGFGATMVTIVKK